MIIRTEKDVRILADEAPHKGPPGNPYWFVAGQRWIKSKQSWSTSHLLHHMTSFTIEAE